MTHQNWKWMIRLVSDLILIPIIIVFAYGLKYKLGWVSRTFFALPIGQLYKSTQLEPYLNVMGLILLTWILTFVALGLYRPFKGLMAEVDEWVSLIRAVTVATIEIMAITFVYKSFPGSRYVVFYAWILGILFLSVSRFFIHRLEHFFYNRGVGLRPALIVGADAVGQDVAERMCLIPSFGFQYVGTLDDEDPDYVQYHLRSRFKRLGTLQNYSEVLSKHDIQTVFITKNLDPDLLDQLLKLCHEKGIDAKLILNSHHDLSMPIMEDFDGISFLTQARISSFSFELFAKRIFDVVVSFFALVVLSPFLLLTALLIKVVSPQGPVLFTQERVGRHNKLFKMMKFRTMVPDAESKTGPVMVNEKNETRYIPCGGFLRRMSIDELPQLFNVLKGEMSIVGPRPERPFFVEQFSQTIPHFKHRHLMHVGITGWAQINGRSVLTRRPEHKLKYDLYYIKNWSVSLDIKIILKTFSIVFAREEAY